MPTLFLRQEYFILLPVLLFKFNMRFLAMSYHTSVMCHSMSYGVLNTVVEKIYLRIICNLSSLTPYC